MSPDQVTATDVGKYKGFLQTAKKRKPRTVNRKLGSLSVFFTWAIAQGLANIDPAEGIKKAKEEELAARWFERTEQDALLQELEAAVTAARTDAALREAQRDRAMLYLMLNAGLRVSEVSDARLDNLTLEDRSGSITVRGKEDKVRIVPLNASARRTLGAWLEIRPAIDDDHVFLGKRRTYLRPDGIYKRVRHYAQRAGIEDISPQTLRHTCGKNLVDQGVSLDRVAAILGYEDLNTTRIYTQPSQSDLAQEVEKIAWKET
jgi:site-specific recombinase XerD